MNNKIRMHKVNCVANLPDKTRNQLYWKTFIFTRFLTI